jgi:DNA modification methylase
MSTAPPEVLACQDNLPWMVTLADGCCDLIYIDPPFDDGRKRRRRPHRTPAVDQKSTSALTSYLAFLQPRLIEMHRLLSPRGSFYVHLDWLSVHHVKVMLDEIFGAEQFLNEIVWSYRSGSRPGLWFARKHDTLLLYAKETGKHTFNRLRGGSYRTLDLLRDEEGRPFKRTRNGPIHFHPDGPALTDVWEIPFLSTASKERTGYRSQKPEKLLERIVRASSDEGDVVADFFCGSGTTLVVAKRLGRRWLGCDISPEAVAITKRRLAAILPQEG